MRSAGRGACSAYWSAWADALPVLHAKVPELTARISNEMQQGGASVCESSVAAGAAKSVLCHDGFVDIPAWGELVGGVAPGRRDGPPEPDEPRHGWQAKAHRWREQAFCNKFLAESTPNERAMLLSQSGPCSARWLSCAPTSPATRLPAELFQIALRRRLRIPLVLARQRCSGRTCRQNLDRLGDHVMACTRSGLVKKRSRALEKAWGQVFSRGRRTRRGQPIH